MPYSPLPDKYIRLDKQNCTKGKTIQCGNACRRPENCKSKTGGQYKGLLAQKRAAMKAQRQREQDPRTLEELFLEADRIGNKYQTPEERQAFQKKLSKEVEGIADIVDRQLPEQGGEAIDFGKGGRAMGVPGSAGQRKPVAMSEKSKRSMGSTLEKFGLKRKPPVTAKDPSKMSEKELMTEIDRTAKAYSKGVDKLKSEVSQFKQATMGFTGAANDLAASAEKMTGGQRSKDEIKPFNRPVKMSPEKELQVRQQVQSAIESPAPPPKRAKAIEISNLRNAIAETEAMIKAKKDQEGTPLDKATIAAMRRAVVYQRAHLQRLGEGEQSAKGKGKGKKSQEGLTDKEKQMGVELDFKGRKTFRGLTIDSMIPDEYIRVSRGDAKATSEQKKKVSDMMGEFKDKTLNIGKSKKKVKSRKQAIAIALSEAGLSRKDSIDSDPYIRLDKGNCTPGKTVKCGNVCRTPVNCKKGKPGSERVKAIGKEELAKYAEAQKAKRQPKAIEKAETFESFAKNYRKSFNGAPDHVVKLAWEQKQKAGQTQKRLQEITKHEQEVRQAIQESKKVAATEPKPKKTRSASTKKAKLTPPKTIAPAKPEPYEPESNLTAGQREHLNKIMTNTEPVKGQLGLFGGEEKPKAAKEARSSGGEGSGRSKAWEELAAKVATEKPDRTGFTKTQKAYIAGKILKAFEDGSVTPELTREQAKLNPNRDALQKLKDVGLLQPEKYKEQESDQIINLDIPGAGQYKIKATPYAINAMLKGWKIKPDDLKKTAIKVDSTDRTAFAHDRADSWGVDILRQWWNDRLSLDLSTCYALRTV